MRDIPIMFSPPMVLALLREVEAPGTGKTQTRRGLYAKRKVKNGRVPSATILRDHPPPLGRLGPEGFPTDIAVNEYWTLSGWEKVKAGDRLWVRERLFLTPEGWRYFADKTLIQLDRGDPRVSQMIAWAHHKELDYCPAIHMPHWASRFTLVVGGTKIEPVQKISNADCVAEGAEVDMIGPLGQPMVRIDGKSYHHQTVTLWFHRLWESLHGSDAWDANPEVVALTFKVHNTNIDKMPKAEAA